MVRQHISETQQMYTFLAAVFATTRLALPAEAARFATQKARRTVLTKKKTSYFQRGQK
jgi:hypothetical protein